MSETLEVVAYLLLFGSELVLVVEVLPATPAAGAEVGALWLYAFGRKGVDGYGAAFGVVFLFLEDFDVDYIAGDDEGDKDDEAVEAGNGFAFGTDVGDGYVFKNGLFFFSAHGWRGFVRGVEKKKEVLRDNTSFSLQRVYAWILKSTFSVRRRRSVFFCLFCDVQPKLFFR